MTPSAPVRLQHDVVSMPPHSQQCAERDKTLMMLGPRLGCASVGSAATEAEDSYRQG